MSTEIAIALKLYKYESNMQQRSAAKGHADMATTQSNPVIAF